MTVYHYIIFLFLFQNTACVDGWPLAIHGNLILHLGQLLKQRIFIYSLNHRIIFFCKNSYIHLCAVWRSFKSGSVVYQRLDPIKDSLTAIS